MSRAMKSVAVSLGVHALLALLIAGLRSGARDRDDERETPVQLDVVALDEPPAPPDPERPTPPGMGEGASGRPAIGAREHRRPEPAAARAKRTPAPATRTHLADARSGPKEVPNVMRPPAPALAPAPAPAPAPALGSVTGDALSDVDRPGAGGEGGAGIGGRGGGRGRGAGRRGDGRSTRVAKSDQTGSKARPPKLIYPRRFRPDRPGEVFVVRLTIDTDGYVDGVRLISGVSPHEDAKALDAVWRFRYRPALDRQGRPTRAQVRQRFMLER